MSRMSTTLFNRQMNFRARSLLRMGALALLVSLASGMTFASAAEPLLLPSSSQDSTGSEDSKKMWVKERDLEVRSAKWPVEVEVEFSLKTGAPRISEDATEIILNTISENRRRLITLEFKGAPLMFARLPKATRKTMIDRSGPTIAEKYDTFVSRQVNALIDDVREVNPKAPIAVKGVPFEGRTIASQAANNRYKDVIGKLSAFVASNSVVVGRDSREKSLVVRSYAESLRLADGRAVIYRANDDWRMALPNGTLARLNEEDVNGRMRGLEQSMASTRIGLGAEDNGIVRSSVPSGTPNTDAPIGNAKSAQALGSPSSSVRGGRPHSGGSGSSGGGGGWRGRGRFEFGKFFRIRVKRRKFGVKWWNCRW